MNIKYLIFFVIFNKISAANRKVKNFEPQTVAQKLKQLDELYFLVHKRVMESNRIAQQTLSDVKDPTWVSGFGPMECPKLKTWILLVFDHGFVLLIAKTR